MAKSNPSTVILKGYGLRDEGKASEAVTPGHLVEFGGSNDIQKHSSAGGNVMATFAVEDELQGKGIDEDYASGDNLLSETVYQGSEVYALLADGENVSKGDFLESAGDGTLQAEGTASSAGSKNVVAIAIEDVDLTGSPTEAGRIKVRIA